MSFTVFACGTTSIPNPTATLQVIPTRLTALTIGKLNLVDNCLRVNEYSLAFPPEFSVKTEKDTVEVMDSLTGDRIVWHIGETVRLGGGEVLYQSLTEPVRQRLSPNCHAPYWIVGGVVIRAIATPTVR
jgi:hypothetical protein